MVQHTEAWQVFAANGEPMIGNEITPIASRADSRTIVGAVHVWIWRKADNNSVEVLLQKRAHDKPTWPGYLDISFAGHVDAGESLFEAIKREGDEEIGAHIDTDRLDFFFAYRNFNNGLKWVYLYEEQEPRDYAFTDGEVESLEWIGLDDLRQAVQDVDANNLVPHPDEYYSFFLRALDQVAMS